MNQEIIVSGDGSITLFVKELNEHYHSVHGALNESMHVFIRSGLDHVPATQINILEIGFGTGLNCFLTWKYKTDKLIRYLTYEKYPLHPDTIGQLNYASTPDEKMVFSAIHQSTWENWHWIDPNFRLKKVDADFRTFRQVNGIDLVYFDAFAPDKHPDLWTPEVFSQIYEAMNPNGVLVTYCAKGIVRRMLQKIGFTVERLPGPPKKMEMIRATKPHSDAIPPM